MRYPSADNVLAANESLDTNNTPLLATIQLRLESLAREDGPLSGPLAREAIRVLALRRASNNIRVPQTTEAADPLAKSRAQYQTALKLLQDPILPVRAQGLVQLQALVVSDEAILSTDSALIPAILDIFVSAVEEEDSFLYLNAVKGLSSMANTFGKGVVARLVGVYAGREGKLQHGMSAAELDKRLRVGEALSQVVQNSGQALSVYGAWDDFQSPSLPWIWDSKKV
jgi:hypothetical protein